jgi:uncharacterized protein
MSNYHGKFVWYELMTSDAKAAEDFYKKVIGWSAQDAGMPGMTYLILSAAQTPVGGLMAVPADACAAGARPCWSGYIAVDDVDAVTSQVAQAGGSIHKPPSDIPGVGRFSIVADPDGAMFILFKPNSAGNGSTAAPGTAGHIGWHELHAGAWERAFAFYAKIFGWTKAEAIDMGPMGTYQLFATGAAPAGGMMTKTPATPVPFWLYYFNVAGIDAAADRVKQNGGRVLHGPQQVPGGSWILQCMDPQDAMFAMVAPNR